MKRNYKQESDRIYGEIRGLVGLGFSRNLYKVELFQDRSLLGKVTVENSTFIGMWKHIKNHVHLDMVKVDMVNGSIEIRNGETLQVRASALDNFFPWEIYYDITRKYPDTFYTYKVESIHYKNKNILHVFLETITDQNDLRSRIEDHISTSVIEMGIQKVKWKLGKKVINIHNDKDKIMKIEIIKK